MINSGLSDAHTLWRKASLTKIANLIGSALSLPKDLSMPEREISEKKLLYVESLDHYKSEKSAGHLGLSHVLILGI